MNAQYSLFDGDGGPMRASAPTGGDGGPCTADERRDLNIALGLPPEIRPQSPRPSWRAPLPGMRFLKLGLEDGSSLVVETALSISGLANELRSRAKVSLTLADGRSTEARAQDVAYIENVYRVPV